MGEPLDLASEPGRYVGRRDGVVITVVDVVLRGTTMSVVSTRTAPAHRGRGYAEQVTRYALADARARGLTVVPVCPYTVGFLANHPEYADLRA